MRRTRRFWTDEKKQSIGLQTDAPTRVPDYRITKFDHLLPRRWKG